ncbi:unnamed protein product [Leptidea sinapis]|uniref:Uncharacterized protein n=1 Tax=Leptidea sinapis TaxID=189913 RepID=A0A5E4QRY2_9NEOP|nr:unnamed protein product [Leptidea sinapis]
MLKSRHGSRRWVPELYSAGYRRLPSRFFHGAAASTWRHCAARIYLNLSLSCSCRRLRKIFRPSRRQDMYSTKYD